MILSLPGDRFECVCKRNAFLWYSYSII